MVLAVAIGCSNNADSTNNTGNVSNISNTSNTGIAISPSGMTGMEILAKSDNVSINSMQVDTVMRVDAANSWISMNFTKRVSMGGNISNRQMYMTVTSSDMPNSNSSMYAVNGWVYVSEPGTKLKWVKTKLTDDIWNEDFGAGANLGLMGMVADAKYLGMENIGGINCYKIDITFDLVALLNATGMSDFAGENSSLQDMFKGTLYIVWVAENTYYPAKMIIDMKTHQVEIETQTLSMSMYMRITYSNVNQPIAVILPAAAQKATAISYATYKSGVW